MAHRECSPGPCQYQRPTPADRITAVAKAAVDLVLRQGRGQRHRQQDVLHPTQTVELGCGNSLRCPAGVFSDGRNERTALTLAEPLCPTGASSTRRSRSKPALARTLLSTRRRAASFAGSALLADASTEEASSRSRVGRDCGVDGTSAVAGSATPTSKATDRKALEIPLPKPVRTRCRGIEAMYIRGKSSIPPEAAHGSSVGRPVMCVAPCLAVCRKRVRRSRGRAG